MIVGREDRLRQLLAWGNELIEGGKTTPQGELPIEPIEIMIAPRSDAIGKTLSQLKLNRESACWRWRYGETAKVSIPMCASGR